MTNHETKVYHFWNGKNIDGKSSAQLTGFENKSITENTSEMRYEVGVDTFSADDLMQDTTDEK